ncbi:MAG: MaoC family dehydratase N-terminal domain-containing protein [Chloroflexi bacterium]|nr:MaoC family dehydratase N-terminal domain-containing protein [Chloroflexota bacterium]
MVLGQGRITEEGLAELRRRLGMFIRTRQFNTEATRDAIRHFADGIGDPNPLFRDAEYARKTRWGHIIAPPCFLYSVYSCAGRAGGLPGVHGLHGGNDWEFFRAINVGDQITAQDQFTDLVEKESTYARRTVIQYSVAHYRNQSGDIIAKTTGWQLRAERRAAQEGGKYRELTPYRYSEQELQHIEEQVLSEEIRGAPPRFWEDVHEGDTLAPVVKGPLSRNDMMAWTVGWGGASGIVAHGIALRTFRRHPAWGYRDPGTGTMEPIREVHYSSSPAGSIGVQVAYDIGAQRISWLGNLMTHWIGDDGVLKKLYAELRIFNILGDTTWCRGKVARKYVESGDHLVDCEIWAENQRGQVTSPGRATVALPSRAGS